MFIATACGRDVYGKAHPEYFALQANGQRGPDVQDWGAGKQQWTKMCVSQPALWGQIVSNWEQGTRHRLAHTHGNLSEGVGNHSLGVSACEDDYDGGYCTCSKWCMAHGLQALHFLLCYYFRRLDEITQTESITQYR